MTSGVRGTWPLAFGVATGDILWTLTAILGLRRIAREFGKCLFYLKLVATLIFLIMGFDLLRYANTLLSENKALSAPGVLPGFLAGVTVILGNLKAILFYMAYFLVFSTLAV